MALDLSSNNIELSRDETDQIAGSTKEAKKISYGDICLGVEEDESREDGTNSKDFDFQIDSNDNLEDSKADASESISEEEGQGNDEDETGRARCPAVKVSRTERKKASNHWKNFVIIKLLGKIV
ncbi:hypothetical protein SESBI_41255 [Sesbania bispinosa]|nr:hypothetical protein SESBI_41255 [Sesbania bispinosa]